MCRKDEKGIGLQKKAGEQSDIRIRESKQALGGQVYMVKIKIEGWIENKEKVHE